MILNGEQLFLVYFVVLVGLCGGVLTNKDGLFGRVCGLKFVTIPDQQRSLGVSSASRSVKPSNPEIAPSSQV